MVYIITADRHYLLLAIILILMVILIHPGGTVYDEYDGSFVVNTVVSNKEFTYKLDTVAQTDPANNAGDVNIFTSLQF